jgi:hypothetical protein
MPHALQVDFADGCSALLLTPVDRHQLRHRRRLALDAQGRPCRMAWRTWDGVDLPPGAVTDSHEGPDGVTRPRGEVVATDSSGRPLRRLTATSGRVQRLEGPVPVDEVLAHVVTRVYVVTPHYLDQPLRDGLAQGDIYRVPFRPRATTGEAPAFLLANAHGVFLLQAAPCGLEWLTREQVALADGEDEDDAETADWGDWLADYADAVEGGE